MPLPNVRNCSCCVYELVTHMHATLQFTLSVFPSVTWLIFCQKAPNCITSTVNLHATDAVMYAALLTIFLGFFIKGRCTDGIGTDGKVTDGRGMDARGTYGQMDGQTDKPTKVPTSSQQ